MKIILKYCTILFFTRKINTQLNNSKFVNFNKNDMFKLENIHPENIRNKISPFGTKDYVKKPVQKLRYNGSVATEVPKCSAIGVQILKNGGNAVDAGVASTICIGIINSFSSGIGGGGFAILKLEDQSTFFDFREAAPATLNKNSYQIPGSSPTDGGKSIAVPGEIKGLYEIHKKYGTIPWTKLFTENIKLATEGFEVSEELEKRLKKLKGHIMKDKGLRNTYTRLVNKKNVLFAKGDIIKRQNFANTLKKIANDPKSFYTGELAKKIVKSMEKINGSITLSDLYNYNMRESQTLKGKYKDYDVISGNLPSSGVFEILGLNILDYFDLDSIRKQYGEPTLIHLLIEVFKFMAANRGDVTDPNYMKNDKIVDNLISKKYAMEIAKQIDLTRPLEKEKYKQITSFNDTGGTSHINIVDKDRNIFMITTSINLEFGSKYMDEETGIIFNNSMDDFYIENKPNSYGLGKMSANKVEPGKRPFSSISPLILQNDNKTIILGAAGGTRISTSVLQVLYHIFQGMTLQEAIQYPRIHHQLTPDVTYVENTIPKKLFDFLKRIGQKPEISDMNSSFTSVQGTIIHANGMIESYADDRKGGEAKGY